MEAGRGEAAMIKIVREYELGTSTTDVHCGDCPMLGSESVFTCYQFMRHLFAKDGETPERLLECRLAQVRDKT
jgi:hypothetical protein